MKFGENLKNIRKQKNISQEELAEKLGVSRQSISKWETGENFPSMNNIMCLCDIFKCKINDLVHENFTDIDSLDSEIKESVVKFKKEKQVKVKLISKIIYVLANISNKIFIGVSIFIAMIMFALPFVSKSLRIEGTDILVSWIYKLTMQSGQYALAAALTLLLSVFVIGIAIWQFKRTKSFKEVV